MGSDAAGRKRARRVLIVGVAPRAAPARRGRGPPGRARAARRHRGRRRSSARFVKERAAPGSGDLHRQGRRRGDRRGPRRQSARRSSSSTTSSRRARRATSRRRWGDEVRVLDRPGLILDVFASHARTREARTQVELAQLQYLLPRLAGQLRPPLAAWAAASAAGARASRSSSSTAARSATASPACAATSRRSRSPASSAAAAGAGYRQVAIAGYTNAGKTTLFNRLTQRLGLRRGPALRDARRARRPAARLRGSPTSIFVDTVGFVRKLPTSLVASFRSTLSEIRDADLVLHVVDALLAARRRGGAGRSRDLRGARRLCPSASWSSPTRSTRGRRGARPGVIRVSAKTGEGLPRLEAEILRRLSPDAEEFRVRIPYTSPRAIAAARAAFRVLDEKDQGDALSMRLSGERRHLRPLARFVEPRG